MQVINKMNIINKKLDEFFDWIAINVILYFPLVFTIILFICIIIVGSKPKEPKEIKLNEEQLNYIIQSVKEK